MKLHDEVLKKIEPSEKEKQQTQETAKKVINAINKEGYEAILVGSAARSTRLAGSRDIDIFVYFAPNTPRPTLEKKAVELGKKVLKKAKTHYAEHPYVKGQMDKTEIEIVPCYKIKKGQKIISAVDRSPLHNEWVLQKLKKEQIKEVLLLKQFLKNINSYGADQKTKGFSGYLSELLIIHYGSFQKLISNAATWNKKTIIDIEKHGTNPKKFIEPLIVIDPVDHERNVAAAVDRTTLSKFIWAARQHKEKPSKESFFREPEKTDLKKKIRDRKIITLSFPYPNTVPEIAWSQLEKLCNSIKQQLHENDYTVYRTIHWTDEKKECVLLFELLATEISEVIKHKGPEIWDAENTKAFIEKNPDYWFYRSRVYAWRKREHTNAAKFVESLLKNNETIPSHLKQPLKKFKIREGKDAHKHKTIMTQYFTKG